MVNIKTNSLQLILASASGFVLAVTTIIASIVQFKLYYVYLTPEYVGYWLLLLAIGGFISILDLGLSPTLSRELAFRFADENPDNSDISKLIKSTKTLYTIISVSVLLLGFLIVFAFLDQGSDLQYTAYLFVLGYFVQMFTAANNAILFGVGKVIQERSVRIIAIVLNLVISWILLNYGFGVISLGVGWLGGFLISRIVCFYYVRSTLSNLPKVDIYKNHGMDFRKYVQKLLYPSLKWAVTALGAALIFKTDVLVISGLIGLSSVPDYEAAVKLIIAVQTISFLVIQASVPTYSHKSVSKDKEGIYYLLKMNINLVGSLVAVPIVYLAFYAEEVVTLWLGEGNFVGYEVMACLLILLVLEVHHVAHASALMATGRIIFYKAALIAGALNVILSIVLVQFMGVFGVALATMISQVITNNWYAPYKTLNFLEVTFVKYMKDIAGLIFVYFSLFLIIIFISSFMSIFGDFYDYWMIKSIVYFAVSPIVLFFILLKDSYGDYKKLLFR